jgi:hypothetical protein
MKAICKMLLLAATMAAPLNGGATPITVGYGGGIFGLEALGVSGNTLTVRYSADLTNFVGIQRTSGPSRPSVSNSMTATAAHR